LPDAESPDSGIDAGIDAGPDAGIDAGPMDAGPGAGPDGGALDAGGDAGIDAGTDPSYPYGHGCSGQQDVTGLVQRVSLIGTDQMMHTYYSYVPASYDGGWAIPLVVSLHGAGDTAMNFVYLWQQIADDNGFMVLLPEGSAVLGSGYTWNIPDAFVVFGAMDDISRCYRTDMHRHILHGFSAGGFIAYIDGLSQSDKLFSGIAMSSSDLGTAEYYAQHDLPGYPPLLPSGWLIPVSMTHGTQDPNFPFMQCAEGSRDALVDAGHTVYFHQFAGGHTTNSDLVLLQWNDLKDSQSP
jgi:poly(3-hydroxybutyrate) depolymerase